MKIFQLKCAQRYNFLSRRYLSRQVLTMYMDHLQKLIRLKYFRITTLGQFKNINLNTDSFWTQQWFFKVIDLELPTTPLPNMNENRFNYASDATFLIGRFD